MLRLDLKITLLCNAVPPAIDGVGDYTFHLAKAMATAGISIEIICRRQNQLAGLPGIPLYPLVDNWRRRDQKKVLAQLEQSRPDWVGIQYVPYGFNRWGIPGFLPEFVRKIKKLGIRVFVMFHEVSVRIRDLQSLLIGCRQKHIARQLCRNSDALFTSIPLYARLLGRFEARAHIIPVGANVCGEPLSAADRLALRRRFVPEEGLLLCTFGNREPALLLESLRLLAPDFPGLQLLVLGHNTRQEAWNNVPFAQVSGPLPPEEIATLIQAADIFVLPDPVSPGGHGGTSNKSGALAAACAAGQAIIGTRGNLNNDLLRHGQNILLADGRDAGALAQGIRILLQSAEQRAQLQRGSRALYDRYLCWKVIARAFLNTLNPTC